MVHIAMYVHTKLRLFRHLFKQLTGQGRIQDFPRGVDTLVIPQHTGWITSYPCTRCQWLHDTNIKYKAVKLGDITVKLFQALYNLVCNR